MTAIQQRAKERALSGPLFTIVIPTYGSALSLDACLDSLASQSYRNFDVVISDGDSPDDTIRVAESWRDKLPHLTISSRRDRGVYDAINQGIQAAQGTWIVILGSDDRLADPGVLEQACTLLASETADFVYGDVLVQGDASFARDGELYAGPFDTARLFSKNICQQAVFYRRTMFAQLGYFDLRFPILADWEFAMRAFARHLDKYIPLTVATFKGGGMSTSGGDLAFDRVRPQLLLRHFGFQLAARRYAPMRWDFYHAAIQLLEERKLLLACRAFALFLILSVLAGPGRRQASQ